MTRTYTKRPVWTWRCDRCGIEETLGRSQNEIPGTEEMRQRGWFIAKLFGDFCPVCVAVTEESSLPPR